MAVLWLTLVVPAVLALVLFMFFRDETVWWEYVVPFLVPVLLVPISIAISTSLLSRDVEYWGGWVTRASYYEPWDERVSCSHEIRDSDGDVVGHSHSYDVDYHGPQWRVFGSNGEDISVDQGTYNKLVKQFGVQPVFRELNRDFHEIDGNAYDAVYPNNVAVLEPMITKHTYENKTQVSDTVYKYPEVDEDQVKQYGLYDYPDVTGYYDCPTVLGSAPATAHAELKKVNALLGRSKQVRAWVMLFPNKPSSAATYQEYYWKGGNKNELNVCIGTDSAGNVTWARVFSWTEKNTILVNTRDYLQNQEKLDLGAFATWLKPEIEANWKRKEFVEFSYLKVKPNTATVVLTWILTLLASIAVGFYIVVNEFGGNMGSVYGRMTNRRRW